MNQWLSSMAVWDCYSAIVADDHELFRAALAEMLRREFRFRSVIEVGSLDEAIDQLGRVPDVALASIDLGMPGMGGAASVHAIRGIYPKVRVTIVSASESRQDILQALGAGVHGYIPKTFRTGEIAAAVRTVLEDKIFVPPALATMTATDADNPIASPDTQPLWPLVGLSPRQKEVLELMARGSSNKQIARELQLAEGTVKVHIAALFRVLGAHNRVSAVAAMTQLNRKPS